MKTFEGGKANEKKLNTNLNNSHINNNISNNNNNNINNTNNSMTMKEMEITTQMNSDLEQNKNYVIEKFGGIPRTILSTVISSIYSLIFIILFLYYTEIKETKDESVCKKLQKWNRALYITLIISLIFSIACTVFQIMERNIEKNVTLVLLIRTMFNYIVGLIFLISITVVYFGNDNIDECNPVKNVDLVYIILEWIIFSVCIIFHYSIVVYFCCCKAKRKYWDGEGPIDPEEIKKVI